MKTSNGTNSKFHMYLTLVLGSIEPARFVPYFKLKTSDGHWNKDKSFNRWQAGREAKRSFPAMVAPVSTSKRADYEDQKNMREDLEGVKSIHSGGKTSFRVSREVLGDENPMLAELRTYPQSLLFRG